MDYIDSIISKEKYNVKQFGNKPSKTLNYLESLVPDNLLEKYKNTEYYKKIKHLIFNIETTGTLYRSSGHCIGVSDMVKKLLEESNINAKLLECNLAVLNSKDKAYDFVGYCDGTNVDPQKEAPTHVVCVTETPVPFLIDLSVYGFNKTINYVVFPLLDNFVEHEKNILTIKIDGTSWIYNYRKNDILVDLHEKNIIDRINKDIIIDKKINLINKVLLCLSIIACLNFVRGSFDFYQKYVNKNNGFGPNQRHIVK